MSSTTLPVCPKTGSTSPSLTVRDLCLHTAPGPSSECALGDHGHRPVRSTATQTDVLPARMRSPKHCLEQHRRVTIRHVRRADRRCRHPRSRQATPPGRRRSMAVGALSGSRRFQAPCQPSFGYRLGRWLKLGAHSSVPVVGVRDRTSSTICSYGVRPRTSGLVRRHCGLLRVVKRISVHGDRRNFRLQQGQEATLVLDGTSPQRRSVLAGVDDGHPEGCRRGRQR